VGFDHVRAAACRLGKQLATASYGNDVVLTVLSIAWRCCVSPGQVLLPIWKLHSRGELHCMLSDHCPPRLAQAVCRLLCPCCQRHLRPPACTTSQRVKTVKRALPRNLVRASPREHSRNLLAALHSDCTRREYCERSPPLARWFRQPSERWPVRANRKHVLTAERCFSVGNCNAMHGTQISISCFRLHTGPQPELLRHQSNPLEPSVSFVRSDQQLVVDCNALCQLGASCRNAQQ